MIPDGNTIGGEPPNASSSPAGPTEEHQNSSESHSGESGEVAETESQTSSSHHGDISDQDTPESREEECSDLPEGRERRDSGVGSSLTRAPRYESF